MANKALQHRREDGFVRGVHPDQRKGVAPGGNSARCQHPPAYRHEIHDQNGDLIVWCELCDQAVWERT